MKIPFHLYDHGKRVTGTDLWDQHTYILRFKQNLDDSQHAYIRKNYKTIMRRSHRSVYEVQFGNHVGTVSLFGETYQVHSKKWSTEKLRLMWAEVSRHAATLPFQQFSVARQAVERTPQEQESLRYYQWVQMRDELLYRGELKSAWESIAREPHNKIITEQREQQPWLASHADDRTFQRMMGAGHLSVLPAQHPLGRTAVSRQLSGQRGAILFPSRITETYKQMTHDTRENRFIKQVIGEWLEVVDWMARYLAKKKKETSIHRLDELEQENNELRMILQNRLSVPWFAEVGRFEGLQGNSTVLQRRQGYRQWFVFYQAWIQGIRYPMVENRLKELVESKNVARVYEYWCFFEVLKAVERVTGCSRQQMKVKQEVDEFQRLGNGLEVHYDWGGETVVVYYNKAFSFKQGGAYSNLKLIPDISLYWRGHWYHFDAKFKRGLIKEDLQKMHVYKDAIKGSKASIALYPARNRMARKLLFASNQGETSPYWEGVGGLALAVDGENLPLDDLVREILRK